MFGDHSRLSLTFCLTPHTERPEPRFRKHTHTPMNRRNPQASRIESQQPHRKQQRRQEEECPTAALAGSAKLSLLDDIRDPRTGSGPSISGKDKNRRVWPCLRIASRPASRQPNRKTHNASSPFSRGTHLLNPSWYPSATASCPKASTTPPFSPPLYPISSSGRNAYPTTRNNVEGDAGGAELRGPPGVHTEQHPDSSGHYYYDATPAEMVASVCPSRAEREARRFPP